MAYNILCNLIPTFLSNLIFLPESFSSPHLSIHLRQIWVLCSSENKPCYFTPLFFLPAMIHPPATFTWLQRQNWKHTIWWDTFGSSWFFGGNAFETSFLPLNFHLLEILVSCKVILQSTMFLSIFGCAFKIFFSLVFFA